MTLLFLTLILITLIFFFCGEKGTRSIISTAMNALVLLVSLYLMYLGLPPVIITACACILITAVTLFYQNEINVKSQVSFASVLIVIAITLPLIWYIANKANAQGFNPEQYETTDSNGYTRNIQIDMLALQISIMIIALTGTVIDTAVAITSSIYEIRNANPSISRKELTQSAFRVSKSILATSIHTIFYIYIAEYMTLMIQYITDYSPAYVLNSKSLTSEFLTVSMSGIGCCLVVPVTTVLGIHFIHEKKREDSPSPEKS